MIIVLLTAIAVSVAVPVLSDDAPTAEQAIERARALERSGLSAEAAAYLDGLVGAEDAPLSGEAQVLLEAARLAPSVETTRAYAARAIERTRDSRILESAHMMIGDSLFAEKLYLAAAREYEEAARHSPGRGPGAADLRHARCLLASGDAVAAMEAYTEIVGRGAVPTEVTSLAELGLGRALLSAGRPEEAAEQFDRTSGTYEDDVVRIRALLGAAESHRSAGSHSSALRALGELVEEYPGTYEAALADEWLRTYAVPDTAEAGADTLSPETAE